MANILILGAGSMGTAFSFPCSDNNHDVSIIGTHIDNDFFDQIKDALEIGVDCILLDNMTHNKTKEAVELIRNSKEGENIFIEASGGMNYEKFQNYLNTGINAISIGGLTHSVKSSDIRLEFKPI